MTELPPSPDRTGLEADAAEGFGSAPCSALARRRPRGLPAGRAPRGQTPPRGLYRDRAHGKAGGIQVPPLPTINALTGDHISARCQASLELSPAQDLAPLGLLRGNFLFCSLSSHGEANSHTSCPTDTRRLSLYSIHFYENTFPTRVHNKVLPDPGAPTGRAAGSSGHSSGWAGSGAGLRWWQGWHKLGGLRAGSAPFTAMKSAGTSHMSSSKGAGDSGQTCGTGLHQASTPTPANPTASLLQAAAKGSKGSGLCRADTALRDVRGLCPPWGSRHLDEVVHGIILGQPATGERSSREPSATGSARHAMGSAPVPYHAPEVVGEGHALVEPLLLRAGAAAAQRVTAHDACGDSGAE